MLKLTSNFKVGSVGTGVGFVVSSLLPQEDKSPKQMTKNGINLYMIFIF
jgi:hypothetical protein